MTAHCLMGPDIFRLLRMLTNSALHGYLVKQLERLSDILPCHRLPTADDAVDACLERLYHIIVVPRDEDDAQNT